MIWFIVGHIFSSLVELIRISRISASDKDFEILILRHQLDVLTRKHSKPVRPNRAEKLTLAILAAKLKKPTNRPVRWLGNIIRIVRPETVIRWHRMLVRYKWTFKPKSKGGRPRISQELEKLIVRLAEENTRWGYGKIEGELFKLGFDVSVTTIRNVLDRKGIVPAPLRVGPSAGGR